MIENIIKKMEKKERKTVSFVALGPGDPELITLKALKALKEADIIFAPSTEKSIDIYKSRSKSILLALGIDEDKILLFNVTMSKNRAEVKLNYDSAALQIAEYYQKGLNIAVTAEGDSGFYSSIQYINDRLLEVNIPTSRLEGIPAFISCGALANIHVVKLEEKLIVIPGITTVEELSRFIEAGDSVVIMKPSLCEGVIKDVMHSKKDTKFHYFENVGVENKEFYTVDSREIDNRKFPYFSLLIIQK